MLEDLIKTLEELKNKEKHVMLTPKGLFINENSIKFISMKLAQKRRKKNKQNNILGVIITNKDIANEIVSLGDNKLFYLSKSDLDFCWVGYIIDEKKLGFSSNYFEQETEFPKLNGKIIPCSGYLHPNDPIFKNCPDIILMDDKIYIAKIITKIQGEIHIFENAFYKFIERIKSSKEQQVWMRKYQKDKRDYMFLLTKMLKESRQVHRKNTVSQLIKHGLRETEYYRNNNWIFVVDINGERKKSLRTVYEKLGSENKLYEDII
ncbi:MAG: hypothetical protein QXG00_00195 [Candidatus Woesearchaeota archaeon]